ncbi:MAG: hypothetical protein ACYDHX_10800 [Methanothrix sp.]
MEQLQALLLWVSQEALVLRPSFPVGSDGRVGRACRMSGFKQVGKSKARQIRSFAQAIDKDKYKKL